MWFLTQHKRWGLLKSDPDYLAVAKASTASTSTSRPPPLSVSAVPKSDMRTHKLIDGVVWDGKDPKKYAASSRSRPDEGRGADHCRSTPRDMTSSNHDSSHPRGDPDARLRHRPASWRGQCEAAPPQQGPKCRRRRAEQAPRRRHRTSVSLGDRARRHLHPRRAAAAVRLRC
jgi:hypothetical protein